MNSAVPSHISNTRGLVALYGGRLARFLDMVLVVLLPALLAVWVTGGFRVQVGELDLHLSHIHGTGSLLELCVTILMLRWLIGRWLPAWDLRHYKTAIALAKRLLELAMLSTLGWLFLRWADGGWQEPLVEPIRLDAELAPIAVMLLLRLLLGRNVNALLVLGSSVLTMVAALYLLESILAFEYDNSLRYHHQQTVSSDMQLPSDFDPTLNDGKQWTWGHAVKNNSFGFRESEFAVPKPTHRFRVMVLGDSLTWGAGLAVEQRYTELLQAKLRDQFPQDDIEVLNFGRAGAPTTAELNILRENQGAVDPNLIVIGFCFNDPQTLAQNYSVERSRLSPLYELIAELRHVGLVNSYRFIISQIDAGLARLGIIPDWHAALDRTYQADSRLWLGFVDALERVKEISDQNGLDAPVFLLLAQGLHRSQLHHPYYSSWYDKAAAAASKTGFRVVDTRDSIVDQLHESDSRVNPQDGHPSAAANQIYANDLLPAVRDSFINWSLESKGVGE